MRVYLETLGCRLNYAEMALLGRQLGSAGYEVAASAAEADIYVLNSCAVTGEAARKSRQLARQLAQTNPGARLVVTGCYASLEAETVAALPNVHLVVGNQRKEELLALLKEMAGPARVSPTPQPSAGSHPPSLDRTRAFIKVQDGCHNHCTFCIVTVARGDERSRSVTDIIQEINGLHEAGYQEAVLTGVHLGAYGRDFGGTLRSLIENVLMGTRIPRLRLSSLEPFDVEPAFFELWLQSNGRLMPHLHLPAQSGSDMILRRMARRNRVADFEALAAAAREHIPGVTLTTDLIAGFPGETQEQFEETLSFARRLRFAHMHVFPYSARAGTAAARFAGQVPGRERRARSQLLNELDVELGSQVRQAFIGDCRPVLWENVVHSAQEGTFFYNFWSGLTDNYLRVQAIVPADQDLHNTVTPVQLTHTHDDELWGTIRKDLE